MTVRKQWVNLPSTDTGTIKRADFVGDGVDSIDVMGREIVVKATFDNKDAATEATLEITPDALDILMDYEWPGNVRELENVIERAVVLSTGLRIDADLVPDHVRSSKRFQMPQFVLPPEGISFREVITDFEKRLIESTLEAAGGVQKRAAELLHIKPTTLNEMIKRHDIRPRRKRGTVAGTERADVSDAADLDDGPPDHLGPTSFSNS